MRYSLVTIIREKDNNLIDGVWIEHHTAGTLETAIKRARSTEQVNRNTKIAVVEELNFSGQNYSVFTNLKRLD